MLRGDSSVWPTRFFGLAKEHVNKRRVFAAVDAESDIDVESSVPVAGAVANHISVPRGTITLAVYTRHSYSEEKA